MRKGFKKDPVKKLQKKIRERNPDGLSDKQRLEGSKFRILNEKLYTTTSAAAQDMFTAQPALFDLMHRGFSNQAEQWPIVPVDEVIAYLKSHYPPPAVIADLGCGEAKIAASIPNPVYSIDFKALKDGVIECDMSHTPLDSNCVDVVLFVLSLMGTNLGDFVSEARRIIRINGRLLIVEVTSRIEDFGAFVGAVEDRGFVLAARRELTSFFSWLEFATAPVADHARPLSLKPCVYKRR
jgi:ribosomal RNA-processing protein 8